MSKPHKTSDAMTDLEFHASGFVARVGGTWTDSALEQFRDYLKKIGITTSADELDPWSKAPKKSFGRETAVSLCAMLYPAILRLDSIFQTKQPLAAIVNLVFPCRSPAARGRASRRRF